MEQALAEVDDKVLDLKEGIDTKIKNLSVWIDSAKKHLKNKPGKQIL